MAILPPVAVQAFCWPPASMTETLVPGPFHVRAVPFCANGFDLGAGPPRKRLCVEDSVLSAIGRALAGAVLEIGQSLDDGFYDVPRPELAGPALRTRPCADDGGRFHFWTIMPTAYPSWSVWIIEMALLLFCEPKQGEETHRQTRLRTGKGNIAHN